MKLRFSALVCMVFSFILTPVARAQIPPAIKAAEASIDAEKIRAHVRFLADDLLEGRAPGLRGGDLAAKYIATQFALYGLKPAGDDGTYLQQVKFFGMTVRAGQVVDVAGSRSGITHCAEVRTGLRSKQPAA